MVYYISTLELLGIRSVRVTSLDREIARFVVLVLNRLLLHFLRGKQQQSVLLLIGPNTLMIVARKH